MSSSSLSLGSTPPVSKLKRKRDPSSDSSSSSEASGAEDVPVLSHAAKRKERKSVSKKALPTESPAKKENEEGHDSRPLKRENSIWVGNLCYKTTPESLRRFFDGVGEVTRVHLPTKLGKASPGDPARRENRGFAYVDFATPEAKNAAILKSESHLEGRRLLIKDGDNFDGRPVKPGVLSLDSLPVGARGRGHSKFAQKILSAQKQPPAPTLFLGNLGFETTVESIRGLLEAHRTKEKVKVKEEEKSEVVSSESVNDDRANDPWIRKIRMGTFEDSGLCKGFAFVDFTSTEHATAALIHSKNHQLDGRKLVVEYASADAVRRGGGAGHKPRKKSTEGHSRRKTRDSIADDEVDEKGSTTTKTITTPSKAATDRRSDTYAKSKVTNGTRTRKSKSSRPTPGAALALAKREQVAIVPSQGRRITFDDDDD